MWTSVGPSLDVIPRFGWTSPMTTTVSWQTLCAESPTRQRDHLRTWSLPSIISRDVSSHPTAMGVPARSQPRRAPIRQVMLKLSSRCNLACTYCYIYQNVDQTWRDQPVAMSRDVVDLAAMRIAEHARRHQPPYVTIIFHGGEPLLAGAEFIAYAAETMRSAVPRLSALTCTSRQMVCSSTKHIWISLRGSAF